MYKNTEMKLTLDSYIKFNLESVPRVHSSENRFVPLQSGSKYNICSQICIKTQ